MFVDNRAREIYGQLYLDGRREELDARIRRFSNDVMGELERVCRNERNIAVGEGRALPLSSIVSGRFKEVIASKIRQGAPRSSLPVRRGNGSQ